MSIAKNIGFMLLGVLIAVGIFCIAVAIGCSINGVSFTAQIAQWFGNFPTVVS